MVFNTELNDLGKICLRKSDVYTKKTTVSNVFKSGGALHTLFAILLYKWRHIDLSA